MINQKLMGLTLVEILNLGYHDQIDYKLSWEDWKHLEGLYNSESNEVAREGTYNYEDLEDTAECNYDQGLGDGDREAASKLEWRVEYLEKLLNEGGIDYE